MEEIKNDRIEKIDQSTEKLEQRIKQLKAQRRNILKRENEKKRKERTRELIQLGAMIEKALGENYSFENAKNLIEKKFYTPTKKMENSN